MELSFFVSPTIGLAWIIAMFVFIAKEQIGWTLVSTGIAILLLGWLTDAFAWFATIPWYVNISFIGLYAIGGVFWMVFKWDRFTSKVYEAMAFTLVNIRNDMKSKIPDELFGSGKFDVRDSNLIDLLECEEFKGSLLAKIYFAEAEKEKEKFDANREDVRDMNEGYDQPHFTPGAKNKLTTTKLNYRRAEENIRGWRNTWGEDKREQTRKTYSQKVSFPLSSREFIDRIALWGMWWPFSLAWTTFSDFIVDFWKNEVKAISGFLDKNSARRFDKTFK